MFVSFSNWVFISLVTSPIETSLVAAASNKHSMSSPHRVLASLSTDALNHVMFSMNIGKKSGFAKVSTLSFWAYVNNDWDWLICPEKIKALNKKDVFFLNYTMQERKLSDESTLPLSFICLSRKRLGRSYLTLIFKCALAIWLRSLTIEISDVPCTGETVNLSPRKLEIVSWRFLEYIVAESLDNVNFFGKNFKFVMVIKFYP